MMEDDLARAIAFERELAAVTRGELPYDVRYQYETREGEVVTGGAFSMEEALLLVLRQGEYRHRLRRVVIEPWP